MQKIILAECFVMIAGGKMIGFARLHKAGNIQIKRCKTTFVISRSFAIDKYLSAIPHAFKMPDDVLAFKYLRHGYNSAIQANRIIRAIVGWAGEASHLPVPRGVDCRPACIIKTFCSKLVSCRRALCDWRRRCPFLKRPIGK